MYVLGSFANVRLVQQDYRTRQRMRLQGKAMKQGKPLKTLFENGYEK
ncbi:MAG TPA: hypothetical protein VGM58_07105 [Verrucomicrobiae bacterium]|jgi:hypothetical protein